MSLSRPGILPFAFTAMLFACGGSSNAPATNFSATMNGANEVPPVTSGGTGAATVTINGAAGNYTGSYSVNFSGLTAPANVSHIQVVTTGGATGPVIVGFTGVPAATSGSFSGSFSATDVKPQTNPPLANMDDLVAAIRAGNAYVNIHTSTNPTGEIRGQLQAR